MTIEENQSDSHGLHEVQAKETALLVSVYKDKSDHNACKEHLDELSLLCETFGIVPLEKYPCLVRKFEAATLITKGKLEEITEKARQLNVDAVIFDDEISPSQQRNLEKSIGISVMDRTEIILGVFAQRAQTKEARLQIELAQLKYEAPRLKRLWTHLSRQAGTAGGGGAGGYLKGEGEKQIEIDRRLIRKRIHRLESEIKEVRASRSVQRAARKKSEIPTFAIIGYTNAGKSTLLNALTDAGVFTEDKLFATLDTTTRKFTLPNNQDVLLIDTVGFIRKLPHHLVAAFKGTLEEAVQADIMIHLIDVCHPNALEQAETTMQVLKELGAEGKPVITVLNKQDRMDGNLNAMKLRVTYPKTVLISALKHEGFDELLSLMIEEISKQRKTLSLRIPQKDYHRISEVIRNGLVINQEYDENDVVIRVELPAQLAATLEEYVDDN